MKVDFDTVMVDLDDAPISRGSVSLTLRDVAVDALLATTQADANLSGEEKYGRFELAGKCKGQVDLKTEEVVKLKKRIGETWAPLVVGRAWAALEG